MTSVLAQPELMAATAANVAQIGSAVNSAKAAAAGSTTGLVAAATDEVSAATAALFSSYAQEYQAVIGQAALFHHEFAGLLAAAGNAYTGTEAAAAGALGGLSSQAQTEWAALTGAGLSSPALFGGGAPPPTTPVDIALIMGGSGTPTPSQAYVDAAYNLFIQPHFPLTSPAVFNSNLIPTSTAEGLYPFTGTKDLTLDISLARGVKELDNAIQYQLGLGAGHTPINVFGYSQSAIVASLEMPKLVAAGVPTSDVTFTIIADPTNPNGGLISRFPGLNLPSVGLTFGTSTPADTGYQTVIYTREYDGFADFPRYPLDAPADLNALMGILLRHGHYLNGLTPVEISSATQLSTSPGYSGGTTYYMIGTDNLPLTEPLRAIPYFGNPLADFLDGPLTPIINWGYGDPAYGYDTGYANVTTPFGFLPPLSDTTALWPALVTGTEHGFNAAMADFQAEGPPPLPSLSLAGLEGALTPHQSTGGMLTLPSLGSPTSTITDILLGLQTANNNFFDTTVGDFSTAYATALPLADIATAAFISLPGYDINLFLDGMIQAVNGQPLQGLVNAFGMPLAANVGVLTLAGGFAAISVVNSLDTILTGNPNPAP